MQEYADALKISLGSLKNSYLNGKSLPGSPVIARLLKLGCDLNWLYFGEYTTETNGAFKVSDNHNHYGETSDSDLQIQLLKNENDKLKKELKIYKEHLRKRGVKLPNT